MRHISIFSLSDTSLIFFGKYIGYIVEYDWKTIIRQCSHALNGGRRLRISSHSSLSSISQGRDAPVFFFAKHTSRSRSHSSNRAVLEAAMVTDNESIYNIV